MTIDFDELEQRIEKHSVAVPLLKSELRSLIDRARLSDKYVSLLRDVVPTLQDVKEMEEDDFEETEKARKEGAYICMTGHMSSLNAYMTRCKTLRDIEELLASVYKEEE